MKKTYYIVLVSLCMIVILYFQGSLVEAASSGVPSSESHYDSRGRLLYYSLSTNGVLNYIYDPNGNITKQIKSNYGSFSSSNIEGWETYRLTDGDPTTLWSSMFHPKENETEWVALDLGKVSFVGSIILDPRGPYSFPKDFVLQSSMDGVTWQNISGQAYSNYNHNGERQTFSFGSSVPARFVRVYATRLGQDDNGGYYFQLGEFQAGLTDVATSSNINGWEVSKLTDGDPTTLWSSMFHPKENETEWVALDLGKVSFVGSIILDPRGPYSFPKDFVLQSSMDGVTWQNIPGQAYSNYNHNGERQTFSFSSSVTARFVRVYATRLGQDDYGGYYFQLGEFQAGLSDVATSSNISGWEASKLTDGDPTTLWSSVFHPKDGETEWVALDLRKIGFVGSIILDPRGPYGFPKDFVLQSSADGVTWQDIPGQTYSNYNHNGQRQTFSFGSSVPARFVRVYATRLGQDDNGGYYFQLGKFQASLTDVATSSNISGWEATRLIDGDPITMWSSEFHSSSWATEWVAIDLHGIQEVNSIVLMPRANLGFPIHFKIQSSNNGVTWSDIPGQIFKDYSNTGVAQTFNFKHPQEAGFIRVIADQLGMDDMGGFYFQLAEVQINTNSY